MTQDKPLVNRVAKSGILTFNLETYFPEKPIHSLDIAPYLFQGLILREKDFREAMDAYDWQAHSNAILCVFCTADAIIPTWAYMLIAIKANTHQATVFQGSKEEYIATHYQMLIQNIDPEDYKDRIVVIKGCSQKPVPASAYASITQRLQPVVRSLMYGEPCSTVPLYKRKKAK